MSQDLRIDRSDAGSFLKIEVSGTLNEALVPEQLAGYADGRPIRIDLEKVSRITSFGVRQWVRGLGELSGRSGGLVLERCSYACVSQLNLISSFSADALVLSVMAPVRCGTCEHEKLVVVDVGRGPPTSLVQPCSNCGADADLEEDPDTYFAFAKSRQLDGGMQALYDKVRGESEESRLRAEAEATAALEAMAKAEADAKARAEAAARAKAEAAAKALADAAARAQEQAAAAARAQEQAEAAARAKAEEAARVMAEAAAQAEAEALAAAEEQSTEPPPPPPDDSGFELEATQVHFVENIEEFVAASEAAKKRVAAAEPVLIAEAEAEGEAEPELPTSRATERSGVDWEAVNDSLTKWRRRYGLYAAFAVGMLIGFLLGRC